MEEVLKKLGLSPVEIKVFLVLLRSGASLAGELSRKSEVNRSNCYDALKRLIEKGLVSYVVRENRKYFQATNAESLFTLLKDKEAKFRAEIENERKEVVRIIPQINSIEEGKEGNVKQQATIYETKRGIKSLLDDMIKEKKEILVLGVAGEISSILDYYLERFHNDRIKARIPLKIILSDKIKPRGEELRKMKYTEIKFLPEEYCSASTANIYGDKVAVMLWSDSPLGILIKNRTIAESYRKQFELLWRIAKKL